MTSPPEPVKHHDTGESSRVTPVSKRWFRAIFKKIIKNQASQPPEQLSTKSGHPVKLGFDSQSQPTASIAQNRSSRYAAGKRQARSVAKPVNWGKKDTKTAKPSHPIKDASSGGQGSAGTKAVQQANEPSQPSAVTGVHVTEEAGNAAVSVAFKFYLPAWMLCLRSGTEDGRH